MKRPILLKRSLAFLADLAVFYVPARVAGFNHGQLVVLWLLYETVLVAEMRGQTIGKWSQGLKVATPAKKPVPYPKAFVRAVVKLVSTGAFLLGDLWVLKSPEFKTWHDQAAGTSVVNHAQ